MRTPNIPSEFKQFRHPGFTNIFEFLPDCPRLYPTETLFGNWQASVLLLAKDGAPTDVMKAIVQREGADGWRHASRDKGDSKGLRTNMALIKLVEDHGLVGDCLFGSALAHLVYDDPRWSRKIPGLHNGPLSNHLQKTLAWVVSQMPNLRNIACLGEDAWKLACRTFGEGEKAARWQIYRDEEAPLICSLADRKIAITAHFHPSRGSHARKETGWKLLARTITD